MALLIASHVSARIEAMLPCRADFFGDVAEGEIRQNPVAFLNRSDETKARRS